MLGEYRIGKEIRFSLHGRPALSIDQSITLGRLAGPRPGAAVAWRAVLDPAAALPVIGNRWLVPC